MRAKYILTISIISVIIMMVALFMPSDVDGIDNDRKEPIRTHIMFRETPAHHIKTP